jgi:mRNA interferase MazF
MVMKKYIPTRGDVVWVDLNPTRGHEQANVRPAIVVSPHSYNAKSNLVLLCPVTSQVKGYPFEVLLKEKKIKGVVLCDQIRSIDWSARNVRLIQRTDTETMAEVLAKIGVLVAE